MVYIRYCNDDKPYDRVASRLLGIVPVCDGKELMNPKPSLCKGRGTTKWWKGCLLKSGKNNPSVCFAASCLACGLGHLGGDNPSVCFAASSPCTGEPSTRFRFATLHRGAFPSVSLCYLAQGSRGDARNGAPRVEFSCLFSDKMMQGDPHFFFVIKNVRRNM